MLYRVEVFLGVEQVPSIPANSGSFPCGYFAGAWLLAFLYNDSFAIPCIFPTEANKISCFQGVEGAMLWLVCCCFLQHFRCIGGSVLSNLIVDCQQSGSKLAFHQDRGRCWLAVGEWSGAERK